MQLNRVLAEWVDGHWVETGAAFVSTFGVGLGSLTVEGINWLVLTRLADSITVIVLEGTGLARLAEWAAIATEAFIGVDNTILAAFTAFVALAGIDFTRFTSVDRVGSTPVVRLLWLSLELEATVEADDETATSAASTTTD